MSRIVFLGTPEIAVVCLNALESHAAFEVVGVITQPDRPAGRGKRLTAPPVKGVALKLGIPFHQPARVRGNPAAIEFLEETRPDLMVVVAFGQILPEEFFSWPQFGTLNVHTSLLPKYRGAAPVIRAIADGATHTGVTIMKIDAGMDTGDILSARETSIQSDETAGELEARLAQLGAQLLLETLIPYLAGTLFPRPQDHSLATLARPVKTEEALLDWTRSASHIHNQIRAFNPRPGAVAEFRGERVKVWKSHNPRQISGDAPPGTIAMMRPDQLTLACGKGSCLDIIELQPANRRRMSVQEFLNGFSPGPGESFR